MLIVITLLLVSVFGGRSAAPICGQTYLRGRGFWHLLLPADVQNSVHKPCAITDHKNGASANIPASCVIHSLHPFKVRGHSCVFTLAPHMHRPQFRAHTACQGTRPPVQMRNACTARTQQQCFSTTKPFQSQNMQSASRGCMRPADASRPVCTPPRIAHASPPVCTPACLPTGAAADNVVCRPPAASHPSPAASAAV